MAYLKNIKKKSKSKPHPHHKLNRKCYSKRRFIYRLNVVINGLKYILANNGLDTCAGEM